MMRVVFLLWAGPLVLFCVLFGAWYFLSYNDINFGSIFLTRAFHDHYFQMLGQMLSVPPETIPATLGALVVFDIAIIIAVGFLGKYRHVWWPKVKAFVRTHILRKPAEEEHTSQERLPRDPIATAIGPVHPAE